MRRFFHRNSFWIQIGLLLILAGAYFFRLAKLPVFADEAIYIRWAQLIIDDFQRYAFFPLNDGKTPLFMWLLVPFQFLPFDHLIAGRTVTVLSALGLVWISGLVSHELGGSKRVIFLTRLLMALLPFWFFSARLALIDVALVFFLSLMVWGALRYYHTQQWRYVILRWH
jgi:4-amino-4-deoxy-L-arabinose transferase-like glycosyltransferase